MILGPFPGAGVVVFHYLQRVIAVSFLTMLAFNRVAKTMFILDFQRMSAIPEKRVLICLGIITSLCTSAHLVQEANLRTSHGMDHFGRTYYYEYLGKVV